MGEIAKSMVANAQQAAANVRPDQSNAVVGCCDPAKHLVLGFFFDGTGNFEKFDNEQAKKDDKWARNRPNDMTQESPGESSPSNVAKLSRLFPHKPENHIHRIYIRGVGTVTKAKKQEEYTKLGQGFGLGEEGGQARIKEAKEKLMDVLDALRPCPPDSVTIDIFGFSRGAALARHFVNVIRAGLPDLSKKPQPVQGVVLPTSQPLGAMRPVVEDVVVAMGDSVSTTSSITAMYPPLPNVTIRFVGLFDTVGSFYWPGNADEGEFILHLASGCAGKIVHLVAADERRKNFPCTDIQGSGGEEITMAGVHSDIGGGYKLVEKRLLVIDSEPYNAAPFVNGQPKAKAAILARARVKGLCNGEDLLPGYLLIQGDESSTDSSTTGRYFLVHVKMTHNGYATVPLHLMYNKAKDVGVPFIPIDKADKPERYAIPDDLAQYASSPPLSLPSELWEKYQHVSAVDMGPMVQYNLPYPLGYYDESIAGRYGMTLDANPKGPRRKVAN